MEKLKILLIMPPMENTVKYVDEWQLSSKDYGQFPPLGLLYIATYLREKNKDVEIKLLDCNNLRISYDEIAKIVEEYQPSVLGITTYTVCLVDTYKVVSLVRQVIKDVKVVLGGPHTFVWGKETIARPDVDYICVGEGEEAFDKLIRALIEGGDTNNIDGIYSKSNIDNFPSDARLPKAHIKDLNSLPILDYSFLDKDIYFSTVGREKNVATMLTSRGCPHLCTFCDVPSKKYRPRTWESIFEELDIRVKEGYKEIFLYDDTFNLTAQRVIEFCEILLTKEYKIRWSFRGRSNSTTREMLVIAKKAGCERIHFGIETGTNAGLEILKKGNTVENTIKAIKWCRELGIKTIGDFMIGLPFEKSPDDVKNNVKSLIRMNPDYAQFNIFQPIPGTPIYEDGVREKVVDPQTWRNYVNNPTKDFRPQLWTQHMDRETLSSLYKWSYNKFYIRPTCILNTLRSIKTVPELLRIIHGGYKIVLKD